MLENLQSHARLASLGQAALDHEFSHPSRLPSSHARGHKVILNPAFLPWVPNPWQPLVSFSRGAHSEYPWKTPDVTSVPGFGLQRAQSRDRRCRATRGPEVVLCTAPPPVPPCPAGRLPAGRVWWFREPVPAAAATR